MNSTSRCPQEEFLLAYLDYEVVSEEVICHITQCASCQLKLKEMQTETEKIFSCIKQLQPLDDKSQKLMIQIIEKYAHSKAVYSLFSWLGSISVGVALTLLYIFLPLYVNLHQWPVAAVTFFSVLVWAYEYLQRFYFHILSGELFLWTTFIVISIIFLNIIKKRGFSDVQS